MQDKSQGELALRLVLGKQKENKTKWLGPRISTQSLHRENKIKPRNQEPGLLGISTKHGTRIETQHSDPGLAWNQHQALEENFQPKF